MRGAAAVLVLVLVAAGCSAILGLPEGKLGPDAAVSISPDAMPPDAVVLAPDAKVPTDAMEPADAMPPPPDALPPDAPPPDASPYLVTLSATSTNILENGTIFSVQPADLSGIPAKLLVPDNGTAGGFQIRTGVGSGSTLDIPDVQFGSYYYLRLDIFVPQYFALDARSVHFDLPGLGRTDFVLTTQTTPLTFKAGGLDAWAAGDSILVFCPNLDVIGYGISDDPAVTGRPMAGDTSLNMTVDWKTVDRVFLRNRNTPLINGDRVMLAHLVNKMTNLNVPYTAVTETMSITGFKQTDGQAAEVSGAFTASSTGRASLTVMTSRFAAYKSAIHPDATIAPFFTGDFRGISQPGDPDEQHIFGAAQPLLFSGSLPFGSEADFAVGEVNFAKYPEDWGRYYGVTINFGTVLPFPSSSLTLGVGGGMTLTRPLGDNVVLSIEPMISPPRDLRVNGASLRAPLTAAYAPNGPPPLVTWDAPELGNPDYYTLELHRARIDGDHVAEDFIAAFWVPARLGLLSFSIPWEAIPSAGTYFVKVTAAIGKPDGQRSNLPLPYTTPFATADALSSFVTLQ